MLVFGQVAPLLRALLKPTYLLSRDVSPHSETNDEHHYIKDTTVPRCEYMLILAYIVCAVACVCWLSAKAGIMSGETAVACVTVTVAVMVMGLFVSL